jgi:bifunctional non-homologous end joining protein LigD
MNWRLVQSLPRRVSTLMASLWTWNYAGKVDHGFDKQSSAELRKPFTPLIRKTQPYTQRVAHKGIWVEPELNADIEYRAKSAEGKVRHPFKGLREVL